jgi:hypothetical protein
MGTTTETEGEEKRQGMEDEREKRGDYDQSTLNACMEMS